MRLEIATRFGCVLMAAIVIGSCGGGSTTSASTSPSSQPSPRLAGVITETKSDCAFAAGLSHLTTGLLTFTMVNQTGTGAGFDVWLIPEGHTYDELRAYIAEEHRLANAGEPGLGHPSFLGSSPSLRGGIDAATSISASGVLIAGTYGIVCIQVFPNVGEPRPLALVGPVIVE